MPRTARIAPQEFVYHILTRGNNKQDVFKDDEDFLKYIDIIKKYKEKYLFKLYHYVLMTNHVHLVMETTEAGGELAQIMKGINLSYAQHYKKKYKYTGHFWQDRFKSIIISKDFGLRQLCGTKSCPGVDSQRAQRISLEQLRGKCLRQERRFG